MAKRSQGIRYAEIEEEIDGTQVRVVVDLDGERKADINTGNAHLDSLLTASAVYSAIDIGVSIEGDTGPGDHRRVEIVGDCIGRAVRIALGEGQGISRFGTEILPVDDALVMASVSISDRPLLVYDLPFTTDRLDGLSLESIEVFFRTLCVKAGLTLHIKKISGHNNLHLCEAAFKAFGRALMKAVSRPTSNAS